MFEIIRRSFNLIVGDGNKNLIFVESFLQFILNFVMFLLNGRIVLSN